MKRQFELGRNFTREKSDGDLVLDIAFSSEEPYERWWGIEILDHAPESVRLARLNSGAALLFNHNMHDLRGTHVPGSVRTDKDRVLRGKVRLTSVTQAGREAIALVETEVLTKSSVGYEIHRVIEMSTSKSGEPVQRTLDGRLFEGLVERAHQTNRGDVAAFRRSLDAAFGSFERAAEGPTTYRVVDWEPFENSLVTVPADNTVGVGRQLELHQTITVSQPAAPAAHQEVRQMPDDTKAAAGASAEVQVRDNSQQAQVAAAQQQQRQQLGDAGIDVAKRERERAEAIRNIAAASDIRDEQLIRSWIQTGADWEKIGSDIIKVKEERGRVTDSVAYLGLSSKEAKRFSVVRAVRAIVDNNWKDAGFEAECSHAIAQRMGRVLNGHSIMVPVEVQQRTLLVGTGSLGGYAVGTDLDSGNFVELLRNRTVSFQLGARRLQGLVGNVVIPKQATGGAVAWIGETGTATASELTLGQLTMSPKHVAGFQQISRQLLIQSTPDAENLVLADLAGAIAVGLDTAILAGTSTDSTQPIGIRYTSGLGTANPTAGTAVDYRDAIRFQTTVATANALFMNFAYVARPAVAEIWMSKARFSGGDTPIWDGSLLDGTMVGRRAMASQQIGTGTTLGGDFSQVIVGEWGALELAVNPFQAFQSGIIGVRGIYSCDVAVRHGAAFAIGTGITG